MHRGLVICLVLAGCSEPRTGGAGESCTKTADCAEPLVCVDKVCVSEKSAPGDPADIEPKTPKPAANEAPSPEPSPTDEAQPSVPTAATPWWCVCYSRKGPEPVTACRPSLDDCQALERRAQNGTSSIVAGSVPKGGNCRLAGTAEHPSSFLSEKDGWLESSKKGSFFRPGACLLPELKGVEAREKANELSRAGPLWLEMPEQLVEELLGKPETVGQPVVTEATGDVTIQWPYPALGATLEMLVPENGTGPMTLHSIWLKAPARMQTTRGVRVGSPFSELERVYADKKAPEDEGIDDGEHFVAGSVYGGMIFARGKDGMVESIFVGADAE